MPVTPETQRCAPDCPVSPLEMRLRRLLGLRFFNSYGPGILSREDANPVRGRDLGKHLQWFYSTKVSHSPAWTDCHSHHQQELPTLSSQDPPQCGTVPKPKRRKVEFHRSAGTGWIRDTAHGGGAGGREDLAVSADQETVAHQVLVYSLGVQYRLRAGYTVIHVHNLCTALYPHLIYNTPIPYFYLFLDPHVYPCFFKIAI